jgi:hypothetical protein
MAFLRGWLILLEVEFIFSDCLVVMLPSFGFWYWFVMINGLENKRCQVDEADGVSPCVLFG